ncbi:MAG: hypothetical protein H0V24_00075 [Chloroflexia bacterium]|nr:hypothetical protein [Chloroflexia bacterium]MDQ3411664.1 hypothetical protein [Chloroflexota bacterium]
MIGMERIVPALAVAGSGWLLAARTASAHAGEVHAPGAIERAGGLGLVLVALMIGVVYWLTNREDRPAADPAHPSPNPPFTDAASPRLVSPTTITRQLQSTSGMRGVRHHSTAQQRESPQPNTDLPRPVVSPSQAFDRGLDPPGASRLA